MRLVIWYCLSGLDSAKLEIRYTPPMKKLSYFGVLLLVLCFGLSADAAKKKKMSKKQRELIEAAEKAKREAEEAKREAEDAKSEAQSAKTDAQKAEEQRKAEEQKRLDAEAAQKAAQDTAAQEAARAKEQEAAAKSASERAKTEAERAQTEAERARAKEQEAQGAHADAARAEEEKRALEEKQRQEAEARRYVHGFYMRAGGGAEFLDGSLIGFTGGRTFAPAWNGGFGYRLGIVRLGAEYQGAITLGATGGNHWHKLMFNAELVFGGRVVEFFIRGAAGYAIALTPQAPQRVSHGGTAKAGLGLDFRVIRAFAIGLGADFDVMMLFVPGPSFPIGGSAYLRFTVFL